MSRMKRKTAALTAVLTGFAHAATLWAQIVPSAVPITPPTTDSLLGPVAANSPPPNTDPRDLAGVYQPAVQIPPNGQLGGRAGGPPTGPPPAAAPRPARPTASMMCEPGAQVDFGGDVNQIIQFKDRIYFIGETNHLVRRVYLDQDFPAQIVPSYAGTSRGHWDGNTLVIETRGLKGLMVADTAGGEAAWHSVIRLTERVTKSADGSALNISAVIDGLDTNDQPVQLARQATDRWRSDLKLMENICEDTAGMFFKGQGN